MLVKKRTHPEQACFKLLGRKERHTEPFLPHLPVATNVDLRHDACTSQVEFELAEIRTAVVLQQEHVQLLHRNKQRSSQPVSHLMCDCAYWSVRTKHQTV